MSLPIVETLRREDGSPYAQHCTGCGARWKIYQKACHAEGCSEGIGFQTFDPNPTTGPRPLNKQVPEQTISDECKYCAEGEPEWSPHAKCWIHRRPTLDKRCLRKRLGPCGETLVTAEA